MKGLGATVLLRHMDVTSLVSPLKSTKCFSYRRNDPAVPVVDPGVPAVPLVPFEI